MSIKKKILSITIIPVLLLGIVSIFLTFTTVKGALIDQIEEALKALRRRHWRHMTRIRAITYRPAMAISGRAAITFPSRKVW